ncbi:MAG: cytochrome C oxidase subunit IV family protein [Rhodospirillaceae bacterium]
MNMPSPRQLVFAWTLLSALTVASMITGSLGGGLGGAAIILAVTIFKARQILHVYLNLRASTTGWRTLFTALIVLILGIVLSGLWLAQVLPH